MSKKVKGFVPRAFASSSPFTSILRRTPPDSLLDDLLAVGVSKDDCRQVAAWLVYAPATRFLRAIEEAASCISYARLQGDSIVVSENPIASVVYSEVYHLLCRLHTRRCSAKLIEDVHLTFAIPDRLLFKQLIDPVLRQLDDNES